MNIKIALPNRSAEYDATPTQKRIRNTKNWAPVAIVGVLFAASIAALITASVIIHNSPPLDFQTKLQRAIPVALVGIIITNLASGTGTILLTIKAKHTDKLFEYSGRDFEGTKKDLAKIRDTFLISSYTIPEAESDKYLEDSDLVDWKTRFTGWSRSNLSPNEKRMGYLLSKEISKYWYRTSMGHWIEINGN